MELIITDQRSYRSEEPTYRTEARAFTIADVAERLGINKNVVKMKILRARRILQQKLYDLM
jgi:DNA-directed RNA polymerase specialized sigma24 family protein